jgi:glycosyltransferase involved in cell wall biosynthesis
MSTSNGPEEPIVILIPVFNDWTAAGLLLHSLDEVLAREHLQVQVLLVDDASTEPPPDNFLRVPRSEAASRSEPVSFPGPGPGAAEITGFPVTEMEAAALTAAPAFASFTKVEILELRRNLGHQRAIAIGLAYIHANEPCQAVLVMDGDGEDDPRDVPRLIEEYYQRGGKTVIFARRTERSESLTFRVGYTLYRWLHQALTGQRINVGNFSILPFEAVDRLVAVTELWNHYAAAVYKARLPCDSIPTRRGMRLAGRPRMNFVSLIIHGLSAISAYGDVVGVRMLLASIFVILLAIAGLLTVVVIRLATDLWIWGWATNAFGLLVVILFQAIMGSILFIFLVLNNRQGANFLPVRDYSYFVLRTRRIVGRP